MYLRMSVFTSVVTTKTSRNLQFFDLTVTVVPNVGIYIVMAAQFESFKMLSIIMLAIRLHSQE